jgi:hypothetical protein
MTAAKGNLRGAIKDGLLLTTRGMHGCDLLARIALDEGDRVQAEHWYGQARRLSSLLPWYPNDASAREISQRLSGLPDYSPPKSLDDLLPY